MRRQALALLVMAVSPVLGVGQSIDWRVGPELFVDSELHAGSEVSARRGRWWGCPWGDGVCLRGSLRNARAYGLPGIR